MKYTRFLVILTLIFSLLTGCGSNLDSEAATPANGGTAGTIVATTYPMYYLCQQLLTGTDGITVEALITEEVSCLHDYTITTTQMRMIESADLIVMNGAGLEHFMESALEAVPAEKLVDSSVGVALIGDDPHIWLDPERYAQQCQNIAAALLEQFPDQVIIKANAEDLAKELRDFKESRAIQLQTSGAEKNIITFHDGFTYFADAFGLNILAAIEEEEGAEPSAAELNEICKLVEENALTRVYVEKNGSTSAAEIISTETSAEIKTISMIMSDSGNGYLADMEDNLQTIMTEVLE